VKLNSNWLTTRETGALVAAPKLFETIAPAS
jgi:hypothetical protein